MDDPTNELHAVLKAILWDNDGVLVDTECLFFEANRAFFGAVGMNLTADDFLTFFLCQDIGIWHRFRELGYSESEIIEARSRRNAMYSDQLVQASSLARPGIPELLRALNGRPRMGVVTSASQAHFDVIHRNLPMRPSFEFVLTAEQYAAPKPHPEPYLLALDRLGLPPEECIAVEDSPRGLQAANAAGLRCIVLKTELTRGYDFRDAFALVDSVPQLAGLLDDMQCDR